MDTEEVNFDDFKAGTYKGKTGYRKIQFCGEQAARDGLQYFWVDSCCINKSNHTELSEAINSMFSWYGNAAKCYVYLSDVSTRSDTDDSFSPSLWKLAFRDSRWFTRAWTLQELIAPHSVEFFSREGERLGDKRSLELSIHEITRIPLEVFRGKPLTQLSVQERMQWAVNRTAKRKEDEAYSLLGIFGLHMPLIYGEGRENAFVRLQEEISRRLRGVNIHGNVHWIVPRPKNDLFTGRVELLLRIQKALRYDRTSSLEKQKRFVITGLGGQGKSEICLQIANQMRAEFWGVFWVDVDKASTAKSEFINIATQLNHSAKSVADALQVLANTKQTWLLILDNADDSNFDYQVYFPSGTHCAVLMTSRVVDCKQYSLDAFEALDGLEDKDSKELLLKAAEIPPKSWPSYSDQAGIVVRLLGSHTLALIQAGAYIARGHCQLDEYPKVYQRQRKQLLKFQLKQARSRYHNVYATFEASAEVLRQSESEAARDALCLLAVLSMLDSAVLPLQIFQSAWDGSREILGTSHGEKNEIDTISRSHINQLPSFLVVKSKEWNPFRLNEASSELALLSLITRHNGNDLVGLSMHPLAHAWARDRQTLEQQQDAWISCGCVLALSRADATIWHTQGRRLIPHIQSYLDIEIAKAVHFGSEALVIPILLKCGWALQDMRQDSELSHLLKDIFIELGKSPEEPSKEFLPLYALQARSLLDMGKNQEDIALLEQIVNIQATTLAETHPGLLESQHTLARAYNANGQATEAIKLLEQVVKIQATTLAETHPHQLTSQHNLAIAYQANGQTAEAIKLLEQVVKIQATTLAKTHPHRLTSQHALSYCIQQLNSGLWR
ncbi:HET-domain-containing protein [Hyaloscypha variabilis F]|uniref:HET-domain-containing protein n=1 Tax=Hyaloscypha variabilis (strain UAMH 11265 / GT02V1 / F) TaxID=1149755 RepID=A0A2J6RJL9_HYAVF|nr:HET-domain-containing protein [Hyaloscypha variabilis F]